MFPLWRFPRPLRPTNFSADIGDTWPEDSPPVGRHCSHIACQNRDCMLFRNLGFLRANPTSESGFNDLAPRPAARLILGSFLRQLLRTRNSEPHFLAFLSGLSLSFAAT